MGKPAVGILGYRFLEQRPRCFYIRLRRVAQQRRAAQDQFVGSEVRHRLAHRLFEPRGRHPDHQPADNVLHNILADLEHARTARLVTMAPKLDRIGGVDQVDRRGDIVPLSSDGALDDVVGAGLRPDLRPFRPLEGHEGKA